MKRKNAVTIFDLAKEMNVSPSTISRALNNNPTIGKNTAKAIKQLARERGYQPNSIAVSLRKQQTNNIGVLVGRMNRPFISSMIAGMEEAARSEGFNILIAQSHDKLVNELNSVHALQKSLVSGLVVSLAMESVDYQHFVDLIDDGIPVLFIDRIPAGLEVHKVIIDNFKAGYQATRHLIDQGCTRIAHFSGSQKHVLYQERRRGYETALVEAGLPVREEYILSASALSPEDGASMTEYLLQFPEPPDAIFAANDTSAVGAILHAKSKGVRIPEELAIIGFNDDPQCQIVEPQLSSIIHPAVEMGRIAIEQMMHILHTTETLPAQTIVLDTSVIARASSLREHKKSVN